MEINILDQSVVQSIIFAINSWQNKQRKEKEWDSYQINEGLMREYVIAELKKLFPKNHRKMRTSDINVVKQVIDKVSKAYSFPPMRFIPESTPEINNNLNALYKNGKFNQAFRYFDQIYNRHKYALMWANYDAENDQYRPQALKPFEYDLIKDSNTNQVLCVILSYPDLEITQSGLNGSVPAEISDGLNQLIVESQFDSGSESKVYALWTATQHAVIVVQKKVTKTAQKTDINYAITYVDIDGNPQNINPLGKLPFVYLQNGDAIDYPVSNPLPAQAIQYNVLSSDLYTAGTMAGFGQAVFKFPEGSEIKDIEIGYMTAVKLPQSTIPDSPETDFTYVNASPNLEGQQKLCLTYLKQVLADCGITGSQSVTGENEKFASGIDRLIATADVQSHIRNNQEQYLDVENDLFQLIKGWESLKGNNEFEQYEEIKVIYEKPQVMISDTEKLNNIKMMIDLGLSNRWQAKQMIDPNLSDDQAKEQIAMVDEERIGTNIQEPTDQVPDQETMPMDAAEAN